MGFPPVQPQGQRELGSSVQPGVRAAELLPGPGPGSCALDHGPDLGTAEEAPPSLEAEEVLRVGACECSAGGLTPHLDPCNPPGMLQPIPVPRGLLQLPLAASVWAASFQA